MADVEGRRNPNHGGVEIRIVLDSVEPPVGHLRAARDPGLVHRPSGDQEVSFAGWLGLLRALYEVTAEPASGPIPGP